MHESFGSYHYFEDVPGLEDLTTAKPTVISYMRPYVFRDLFIYTRSWETDDETCPHLSGEFYNLRVSFGF